jgi:N-succinyldiaminopimelate aminotransferase
MNPNLAQLQPYPFEKLAQLKAGITPPAELKPIFLSIGEPQHPAPEFVKEKLAASLSTLSKYPTTNGSPELRGAIADWLSKRFKIDRDAINAEKDILPVNGTREALFAIAQCVVDPKPDAVVVMPNPFYQIYEGAAIIAGAKPFLVNCTESTGYVPDFASVPDEVWQRCQLLFICSPGNPTGAVLDVPVLKDLIHKARKYNFVICSDECYSEIYFDETKPPPGLLQVDAEAFDGDFKNCLAFHSLSKRSSLPGMRSGFVAGDPKLLEKFWLYRTYHGCAMAPPFQFASIAAWADEQHVLANRDLYRKKFDEVLKILQPVMNVQRPDAGFYLWPETPIGDEEFARELFKRYNLTVLPGSYLSREAHGINPGANRVRMALVPSVEECVEAAERIRKFIGELNAEHH